jgi:ATP-dependent RNA helicase DeaD
VKDHLERGTLTLTQLRMCILDEADQMLDSGFGPVIEEILATTPDTRQMALFSATIPDWVAKIQKKFLKDPVNVAISAATSSPVTIEQITYQVPQEQKMAALCTLLHSTEGESSLIFGRTKFGVEKLGKQLNKLGFTVGTLHGNKSQRAREEVLSAFRNGQVQTLLATDVAARGLDVKGIYQVINYELPESSELFTHRIGRTGRMGRQGKAITLLAPSDVSKWRRMARNLGQAVALQRLAIDEEAIFARSLAKPEVAVTQDQEREEDRQPRPVRDRKAFSPDQERVGKARSGRDSYRASGPKRRQKERFADEMPAWQSEDSFVPEQPYSGKGRRIAAEKQSAAGRAMTRPKTHAFTAAAPQPRTTRRRPEAPARQPLASKRWASR